MGFSVRLLCVLIYLKCALGNKLVDNKDIYQELARLQTMVKDLSNTYDDLYLKYQRQEILLSELVSSPQTSVAPGTVGFTAFANQRHLYEIDEKIYFNNTATNIGGDFNPDNSEFVCPITGTYYFVINMECANEGYMIRAELILNTDTLIATAEVQDASLHHMSSNSVVLACNAGSRVWVRAAVRSEVEGGTVDLTTSFSGFLIAADT